MNMRDIILDFNRQFRYEPVIENEEKRRLGKAYIAYNQQNYVVIGMGGSHLAGDAVRYLDPHLPLVIHKNYGFPDISYDKLLSSFVIIMSHSGNTEEALDSLDKTLLPKGRLNRPSAATISSGGRMYEIAKAEGLPYIHVPDIGIPPRAATGLMTRALLKMMGLDLLFRQTGLLARLLKPDALESAGEDIAKKLYCKIPLIYASAQNDTIAQNWKIRLNETAKTPAFYNVFPELNHNEMNAFDANQPTKFLADLFHFIFLTDKQDHPGVQKRMAILAELYLKTGRDVEVLELNEQRDLYTDMWPSKDMQSIESACRMHKLFSSIALADWTAYYLAKLYGVNPIEIPIVEEFKKLMAAENT